MIEFKNLKELVSRLSDEDVCRKHMEKMRWGAEPFCPHCSSTKPYRLKNGKTLRCSNPTCRKNFTVTVGTVFENSKIKLSSWMAAMYLLTAHKKGISSLQLSRDIGVTQKTAWFMLHRLRLIMVDPNPKPLQNIVEVDETYVGGKMGKMNRAKRKRHQELGNYNKVAVMGLIERDGQARMQVIGDNNFKDIIRRNVGEDAILITDSHQGYTGLDEEYQNGHYTVNHSQMQFRQGIACTNTIEGFFSFLKRSYIGCYHYMSPKHLQLYCIETCYRYNTRKIKDADRFTMTLQNVEGRLKYKTLISNN